MMQHRVAHLGELIRIQPALDDDPPPLVGDSAVNLDCRLIFVPYKNVVVRLNLDVLHIEAFP